MELQLGIVAHVGIHTPDEGRHDTREDGDEHLQHEHRPESRLGDGHEEEGDAQHQQHGIDEDERGLLAQPVGDGHAEGHTRHVGHLADTQEESCVEQELQSEEVEFHILPDDVEEEIGHRGTSRRIEQVGAQGSTDEQPPGLVGEQRLEVAAHADGRHRLEVLAGKQEAEDEHHETGCRDAHHTPEPAVGRLIAAEHIGQGLPDGQGDERAAVGEEHTEGAEHRLLVGVVGHHAQHGTIGHVDTRIDGHHQDIRHVGPDELGTVLPVGCGEQQDAADGEQRSHPQQIGAVLAPARVGTVGDDTHHGVGDGIPYTRDEQQHAGIYERQSEDVGVEYRQVVGEHLPECRRRHVAESVADLFD